MRSAFGVVTIVAAAAVWADSNHQGGPASELGQVRAVTGRARHARLTAGWH